MFRHQHQQFGRLDRVADHARALRRQRGIQLPLMSVQVQRAQIERDALNGR